MKFRLVSIIILMIIVVPLNYVFADVKGTTKKADQKKEKNVTSNMQKGSLSGVVTYYFNSNQGDLADIGTDVCIIDADTDFPAHNIGYDCSANPFSSVATGKILIACPKDEKRSKSYPIIKSTKVDGVGRYEMKDIPIGEVTVLIISNHRRKGDMSKQIFSSKVEIKPNETKDLSCSFTLSLE